MIKLYNKIMVNGANSAGLLVIATIVSAVIGSIAAWITHIIVSLSILFSATTMAMIVKSIAILVLGTLIFPAGIIHGIGIWFGAW